MRAVAIFCLTLALPWCVLGTVKRPNILLILADDLGFHDVGWPKYADIPTPHLNQLRNGGVELTHFYTQPKCTPARAALLTGRYPFKMGMQTHKVFSRVHNNTLNETYKLLPAYLKDLGYHTHMAGKWHLGACNYNATPLGRGFDSFFGPWDNLASRYNLTTTSGMYDWTWNNEPYWPAQNNYTVHLLTNHTQHIMKDHFTSVCTKDEPIFMYLAYTVPHLPLEVPDKYITDTNCSLIPEQIPYNATTMIPNNRRRLCGMVNAMDEGIGNITKTLEQLGVLQDFLIFFTSDNGCIPSAGGSCWPFRGHKQSLYEGGTRVRTFLWGPKHLKKGLETGEYDGLMHITDVLPTLLTAAKGNVSVLPRDIDGKNAWWNIRKRNPTWRTWMVYNIFSDIHEAAIRFKNATHDFKLIYTNGSTQYQPGYKGPDPRPESEQLADGPRKSAYFRNGVAYFMYNMNENPEERPPLDNGSFPDATITHPAMFRRMKNRLKGYLTEEVPIPTYTVMDRDSYTANGAIIVGGC